jgi:hypothetical protein
MMPCECPVNVLSAGRSGSTLLQKLLNTHEELTIWGEHEGFLNGLATAWSAVMQSEWIKAETASGEWLLANERPLNADRWTAWDGSFSKANFQKEIKELLDRLFVLGVPESRRWGFKEIRYQKIEVVELLLTLYPGAQFILLLRNPVDACVSFMSALQKRNDTPEQSWISASLIAQNQINKTFSFVRLVTERFPTSVKLIFYERLAENPNTTLEDIRQFLNLSAAFDLEVVTEILATNLMSERNRNSPEQLAVLKSIAAELLAEEIGWYEHVSC